MDAWNILEGVDIAPSPRPKIAEYLGRPHIPTFQVEGSQAYPLFRDREHAWPHFNVMQVASEGGLVWLESAYDPYWLCEHILEDPVQAKAAVDSGILHTIHREADYQDAIRGFYLACDFGFAYEGPALTQSLWCIRGHNVAADMLRYWQLCQYPAAGLKYLIDSKMIAGFGPLASVKKWDKLLKKIEHAPLGLSRIGAWITCSPAPDEVFSYAMSSVLHIDTNEEDSLWAMLDCESLAYRQTLKANSTIKKKWLELGTDAREDVAAYLRIMSHSEANSSVVEQYIDYLNTKPTITGFDVMGLGYPEGPEVGRILGLSRTIEYANPELDKKGILNILRRLKIREDQKQPAMA